MAWFYVGSTAVNLAFPCCSGMTAVLLLHMMELLVKMASSIVCVPDSPGCSIGPGTLVVGANNGWAVGGLGEIWS